MLSIGEHASVEEAGTELLAYILDPRNWVVLDRLRTDPAARPGDNPSYQRRVGALRICASVDITPELIVFLRIAFRGPKLAPMQAADHLEAFLKSRLPFTPNSEWQVEVDERRWIHFIRRYTGDTLVA
jgi:hypothetical protein